MLRGALIETGSFGGFLFRGYFFQSFRRIPSFFSHDCIPYSIVFNDFFSDSVEQKANFPFSTFFWVSLGPFPVMCFQRKLPITFQFDIVKGIVRSRRIVNCLSGEFFCDFYSAFATH